VLDDEIVRRIGIEQFFICEIQGDIHGTAALWDQRGFKQIVARRYRAPLGAVKPLYNVFANLSRRVPLPREGHALDQTSIAFLALSNVALDNGAYVLRDLLTRCNTAVASLGVHAAHPLVPILKKLKPISYPAGVYAVSFDGPHPPNGRPAQPEAALL
jgi:hypothetical protein